MGDDAHSTKAWLAASIMVVMAAAVVVQSAHGIQCSFAATCRRARVVNDSVLVAACREVSGEGQDAVLDLNEHVSNVEGNLLCTPAAGGFVGTCSRARIVRQSVLSADCLDTAADRSPTALDLNECVANIDGSLQWCGLDSGG